MCANLLNENQAVHTKWGKRTPKEKHDYKLRLSASTMLGKRLLNGGLAFHGYDESKDSLNKEYFLELLKLMGEMNEELVDESCDVFQKQQMAVVICYVDKVGIVKERFIMLVHVKETSTLTLKSSIDDILARYGLSLKRIRGQDYDGTSNMSGEFNDSYFYIHCFAHQLQLVVEAVAHKHTPIWNVKSFCDMYELEVKILDNEYINPRWPRRKTNIINRHYYECACFNAVLDLQIQEFGNRCNEVTSELLVYMNCSSLCDNFSAFDIPNIKKLTEKYPYDFDEAEKRRLPDQLENYINYFVKQDK
ncbi:zinc finger MYM-type protein 1-like [Helianthus annuus]|uniref:zinc finger MYM-type protein 1-like n=1 Tax=Helianthus annuus TaxID=4232 RepID=UPI000B8FF9AA|nr:zinc finger MYM-type protein 1-like [Helianthus annuus]